MAQRGNSVENSKSSRKSKYFSYLLYFSEIFQAAERILRAKISSNRKRSSFRECGWIEHRCDVMLYDVHLSDSNLTFARNGHFGATPKCTTFGHLREVWRRYDACSFVGIRISSLIGRWLSRFAVSDPFSLKLPSRFHAETFAIVRLRHVDFSPRLIVTRSRFV